MKRIVILIVIMVLLVFLSGCATDSNEKKTTSDDTLRKEIKVENNDLKDTADNKKDIKEGEVTIAIWERDYYNLEVNFPLFIYDSEIIKKEVGVDIKFDIINANTEEEFIKKLNTKLYLDKGPTLIYIQDRPVNIYVDSGIALKLEDKVENLHTVYDSINDKNGYFAPIGMMQDFTTIDKEKLKSLNIKEPNYNWDFNDYMEIRDKWIKDNNPNLTVDLINGIYEPVMNKINFFDEKNKKAKINTDEVKETIKYLRDEFFGGKYKVLKGFNGEDYYNVCFTKESLDPKYFKLTNPTPNYIFTGEVENLLNPINVHNKIIKNKIVLTDINSKGKDLSIGGFLVNKNGQNKEKGIKLIDYILSNKVQMRLYNYEYKQVCFYPVNKDIEEEIKSIEDSKNLGKRALELKRYVLTNIKEGKNKAKRIYEKEDMSKFILNNKLHEDIFRIVFWDEEYGDKKLERKLQELENQYTIWMNE